MGSRRKPRATDAPPSPESMDVSKSLLTAVAALMRNAEPASTDYYAVLARIVERYVDARVEAALVRERAPLEANG